MRDSLKQAWRSLRRTPAFTATAVLTLAIGVAATVAVFTIVNRVLLQPLPYGNPERLVGAWHDMPPISLKHVEQSSATYFAYLRHARTIEGIGAYQDGAVNVSFPGADAEPQRVGAAWITATLIPVLQVPPLLGRSFTEDEDRPNGAPVVMISEDIWRGRFAADRGIIGRTLDVNGVQRQVVGVMPRRFRYPGAEIHVWVPLALQPEVANGFSYRSVARLKPDVTIEQAEGDFASVLKRLPELYPTFAPGVSTAMVMEQAKPEPLLVPLREDVTADVAGTLWTVLAAAGLVLLIAVVNVMNLILVRADGRQREIAVLEALGAGRARVLEVFVAESAVLAVTAGALGAGLAFAAVRVLAGLSSVDLPRMSEVSLGGVELAFAALLAAVIALACGAVPALRIGRVQLANALREGGKGGSAGRVRHRVRATLVSAQIALALVVLAASALLVRTFQNLSAVRPGFEPAGVMTMWVSTPSARYRSDTAVVAFYSRLVQSISALPGVQSVGIASRLPMSRMGENKNPFYPEGDERWATKIPPLQLSVTVGGDYFRAMGIPLLAGRGFGSMTSQRADEAVISRTTARQFFNDSTGRAALGKRFRQLPGGPLYTVVGVANDVRDSALTSPPAQVVYFPQAIGGDTLISQLRSTMGIVVKTSGVPASQTTPVRNALRTIDPTLPTFQVRSMEELVRSSMARLSFVMVVLGSAAAVALLLGAIGLYGVMAYLVTLRRRDLGVRIALGARPMDVEMMMTRQGLLLAGAGLAAGLLIFAVVIRFLRSFLYGVAPADPLALSAASITLLGVAVLASWLPARRAARLDPAMVLREE